MSDSYKCACCLEEFGYVRDETWNDCSAEVEYKATFGMEPDKATGVVCDDCYNAMLKQHWIVGNS